MLCGNPLVVNVLSLVERLAEARQRKYKGVGVATKLEDRSFNKNQSKFNTSNKDLACPIIHARL